ncbi:transcriptional regulator, HxlR family [Beutenbergia cavernae DSM 12333]|uniref:Transcriptional regulator, HxlR family n=1 Tax=Beutenbergia cavernae (strain ATCC BAA-8 / DSM 12333 / CCUG 43141 / JCM 11478 / NBRC 16432 / NCIMB 13614 / HKI 0122) TaxID=471853 RepID=C5C564_BEUC1|nr:helix-turn-helix domain-containing protein [Beutenbergia cavernae]ACQ82204.1 transcriptional regulator, HxlR family [Beutenbergia cavernae DSM 12333]
MNKDGCEVFVSDCHVRAAVELINHTWDPVVVSALRMGPTRRSVLLGRISGASDKVLTESLRRLTSHGLVTRASSESRRDTALYELTALGASFASGPLAHLAEWAAEHQVELSSRQPPAGGGRTSEPA